MFQHIGHTLFTVWNVNQPVGLPLSDAVYMQRSEQNELKQPLAFYTEVHACIITDHDESTLVP